MTELLTKEGFSVMAALICILKGLPKDDRMASFRFRARLGGIETAKKLCTDGIARFSKNLACGNRTKTEEIGKAGRRLSLRLEPALNVGK